MKKLILCIFLCTFCRCFGLDQCSHEYIIAHFPKQFVSNTLTKYNIPESEWEGILNDLNIPNSEIIVLVEEKAAKMEQNPLRNPQYGDQAVQLFRDTMLEVFTEVMYKHGVKNQDTIQAMLADIQSQKAKKFAQCMKAKQDEIEKISPEN